MTTPTLTVNVGAAVGQLSASATTLGSLTVNNATMLNGPVACGATGTFRNLSVTGDFGLSMLNAENLTVRRTSVLGVASADNLFLTGGAVIGGQLDLRGTVTNLSVQGSTLLNGGATVSGALGASRLRVYTTSTVDGTGTFGSLSAGNVSVQSAPNMGHVRLGRTNDGGDTGSAFVRWPDPRGKGLLETSEAAGAPTRGGRGGGRL